MRVVRTGPMSSPTARLERRHAELHSLLEEGGGDVADTRARFRSLAEVAHQLGRMPPSDEVRRAALGNAWLRQLETAIERAKSPEHLVTAARAIFDAAQALELSAAELRDALSRGGLAVRTVLPYAPPALAASLVS